MANERRPVCSDLKKLAEFLKVPASTERVQYRCNACRDTGFVTQISTREDGKTFDVAVRCGGCDGARWKREAEAQKHSRASYQAMQEDIDV